MDWQFMTPTCTESIGGEESGGRSVGRADSTMFNMHESLAAG